MSENLEMQTEQNQDVEQDVSADAETKDESMDSIENSQSGPNDSDIKTPETENDDRIAFEKFVNVLDIIRKIADKKNELESEISSKREYLSKNLVNYDTEDYFQNENFKNLYSEAFNALGTNLNTEKFIDLLDKYVSSRIEGYNKKLAAQKENDEVTDGFEFASGNSKKLQKNLRLQDIPDKDLEWYISQYI